MHRPQQLQQKIQSWTKAQTQVQAWQANGQKVVFTNGCFDLVHFGHLYYLAEASALGDRLVVALNSTASVQRLKGPHRPIKDEASRLLLMASLEVVDLVVTFEQDTPLELITCLQPDILVKGGDWQPKDIVGSDLVLAKGGEVHSLPFHAGYSTTNLEQKILNSRNT